MSGEIKRNELLVARYGEEVKETEKERKEKIKFPTDKRKGGETGIPMVTKVSTVQECCSHDERSAFLPTNPCNLLVFSSLVFCLLHSPVVTERGSRERWEKKSDDNKAEKSQNFFYTYSCNRLLTCISRPRLLQSLARIYATNRQMSSTKSTRCLATLTVD